MTAGRGPDPLLVGSAAHVVVERLDAPELDETDEHHLRRVLRLRPGEPVTVTDGSGGWRPCRLDASAAGLELDGDVRTVARPDGEVAIAFAPPKGDRAELIVQKLTELGADRIVPMLTERSIVRWDDDRAAAQHRRWSRIVREAAMQSRRVWLPVLEPVATFEAVATRPGAHLAAPGGRRIDGSVRLILIGPEGGWSETELRRPLSRVGLGDLVLRAETAAIAACALAVSARADLVGESAYLAE